MKFLLQFPHFNTPGTRYDARVHNCNHNFLAPPCKLPDNNQQSQDILFNLPPTLTPVAGQEGDKLELETESLYVVSPTSLYACPKPGYFSEETSCNNFYVCKEVTPGVLTAERVFRYDVLSIFSLTENISSDVQTDICLTQRPDCVKEKIRSHVTKMMSINPSTTTLASRSSPSSCLRVILTPSSANPSHCQEQDWAPINQNSATFSKELLMGSLISPFIH